MSSHAPNHARVTPLCPAAAVPTPVKEPLWRNVVGDVLRHERLAQERTLKDVAEAARISMPYLSELERGRKEASSEVLAAAARALGLGLAELLDLARGKLARLERARKPKAAPAPITPQRDVTSVRPVVRSDGPADDAQDDVTPMASLASFVEPGIRSSGASAASPQGMVSLAA